MVPQPDAHRRPPAQLVQEPAALRDLCESLRREGCFAFDTEFVGEDQYRPEVCLMQAATSERCWLVDPLGGLDVAPLWELVADPGVCVILHAASEDLSICYQQTGRRAAQVFDVQIAAGLVGLDYPISLSRLARATIGESIHKSETLTDWRSRPLSAEQMVYATADVAFLPRIHAELRKRLVAMGRLSWAEAECEELCQACASPPTNVEKVRKLRGAGSLRSQELAIAHAILEERDKLARSYNRPARAVLKDHLVVEIARHGWTNPRRIETLRGLNLSREGIRRIAAAVEHAKRAPADAWPTNNTSQETPEEEMLLSLLNAVLRGFCLRHKLAYSLLATKQDLRAIVRAHSRTGECPSQVRLLQGWRREAIGDLLEQLLSGRSAVVVEKQSDKVALRLVSRSTDA